VHSVNQRSNLRHLFEPLGGTEGLIEAAGFKKTTECMWWRTSVNARMEWVPYWGRSNAKTTGSKRCVDTRNGQQIGVGGAQRTRRESSKMITTQMTGLYILTNKMYLFTIHVFSVTLYPVFIEDKCNI